MRPSLAQLAPSLIRQMHARKRPSSLDVSLGEPTLSIDPELWQRGLARHERSAKGYTPNLGLPELRTAIAGHHRLPGRDQPDNVIVTVGSEEALFLCFFGLLDVGDEVIIADPAYPAYASLATMCGAQAVRVPLSDPDYRLSASAVAARVSDKTRLVVISSPSNPFGRCEHRVELQKLAALADERGFWLISDEIYGELYFGDSAPASVASMSQKAILISGLSKSCAMTGHRLGYLIADRTLVQSLWPVHQLTVTSANTLAQHIAIEAFLDPRFLSAHRPHYVAQWKQAKAALDRYGIPYIEPEGAFYVMCPVVPDGVDAFAFCKDFLDREDVVSVPGTAFGPAGASFVRLSIVGDEREFATAVERLRRFRFGS